MALTFFAINALEQKTLAPTSNLYLKPNNSNPFTQKKDFSENQGEINDSHLEHSPIGRELEAYREDENSVKQVSFSDTTPSISLPNTELTNRSKTTSRTKRDLSKRRSCKHTFEY